MQDERDVHAGPALTTQNLHELSEKFMGVAATVVRPRGAVLETGTTFLLIAANPFTGGMRIDLELGGGRVQGLLPTENGENQLLSTNQGESGILVDVHSVDP